RQASEIQAGHDQHELRGRMFLPVPIRIDDVNAPARRQRAAGALQDRHDLLLAEAIEELAHPYGVLTAGKLLRTIQEVDGMVSGARSVTARIDRATRHLELPWQIEQRDFH